MTSRTNVILSTNDIWVVSDDDDFVFLDDKSDAVIVANAKAILRNSNVVVYSRPYEIEYITKSVELINQRIMERIDERMKAITQSAIDSMNKIQANIDANMRSLFTVTERFAQLMAAFEDTIHVHPTENHWQVNIFGSSDHQQFDTKNAAIEYAYGQALEQGYIIYIYDEAGYKTETIDPEDNLELSDEVLEALNEKDGKAIPFVDFKREIGLNE